MTRNILFLGGGSPFMMGAVVRNLEKAGFTVDSPELKVEVLRGKLADARLAVLFLGPALLADRALLDLLNGMDKDAALFVIGYEQEQEECLRTVAQEVVTARFQKPLDIKEFLAKVREASGIDLREGDRTILLVDDDADYLKMVSRWLSGKYRVAVANSGMQALKYLANNKPDLILLDYTMPVTSGPQVLEMIRSEPDTAVIPVMFLTGKDDRQSVMEVMSLKPDGYILKSSGRDALLVRVGEFFRSLDKNKT